MTIESISIALLCTIIGSVIGILTFSRAKSKDDKSEGQQSGQMLTELGYIKSGIDDIKIEQREQRKINTDTATKLAAVEASAKQAHRRLDQIEGREYPGQGHEH